MRLGLNMGYSGSALRINVPLVQEADRLGFHSVWSAEAYGSDAVTTITWVAALTKRIHVGTAIMQIPARTPTLTATTAITLDQMSEGRFLLGLGVSGPQVVEGWHGVAFGKPLARTREYVEIVRSVWRREEAGGVQGAVLPDSLRGDGRHRAGSRSSPSCMGGRTSRSTSRPSDHGTVALAAEIADGWLPIFFSPQRLSVLKGPLEEGFARAGGESPWPGSISPLPCPWWWATTLTRAGP
jgi:alkanesulfonate monooxygenase SsuD/methylene tetrahydromethanopterin reductase-like flavin-dependent oxidoreductase (luciferase family)